MRCRSVSKLDGGHDACFRGSVVSGRAPELGQCAGMSPDTRVGVSRLPRRRGACDRARGWCGDAGRTRDNESGGAHEEFVSVPRAFRKAARRGPGRPAAGQRDEPGEGVRHVTAGRAEDIALERRRTCCSRRRCRLVDPVGDRDPRVRGGTSAIAGSPESDQAADAPRLGDAAAGGAITPPVRPPIAPAVRMIFHEVAPSKSRLLITGPAPETLHSEDGDGGEGRRATRRRGRPPRTAHPSRQRPEAARGTRRYRRRSGVDGKDPTWLGRRDDRAQDRRGRRPAPILESASSAFACWSRPPIVCGTRPVAAGRKTRSAAPNANEVTASVRISAAPVIHPPRTPHHPGITSHVGHKPPRQPVAHTPPTNAVRPTVNDASTRPLRGAAANLEDGERERDAVGRRRRSLKWPSQSRRKGRSERAPARSRREITPFLLLPAQASRLEVSPPRCRWPRCLRGLLFVIHARVITTGPPARLAGSVPECQPGAPISLTARTNMGPCEAYASANRSRLNHTHMQEAEPLVQCRATLAAASDVRR